MNINFKSNGRKRTDLNHKLYENKCKTFKRTKRFLSSDKFCIILKNHQIVRMHAFTYWGGNLLQNCAREEIIRIKNFQVKSICWLFIPHGYTFYFPSHRQLQHFKNSIKCPKASIISILICYFFWPFAPCAFHALLWLPSLKGFGFF